MRKRMTVACAPRARAGVERAVAARTQEPCRTCHDAQERRIACQYPRPSSAAKQARWPGLPKT